MCQPKNTKLKCTINIWQKRLWHQKWKCPCNKHFSFLTQNWQKRSHGVGLATLWDKNELWQASKVEMSLQKPFQLDDLLLQILATGLLVKLFHQVLNIFSSKDSKSWNLIPIQGLTSLRKFFEWFHLEVEICRVSQASLWNHITDLTPTGTERERVHTGTIRISNDYYSNSRWNKKPNVSQFEGSAMKTAWCRIILILNKDIGVDIFVCETTSFTFWCRDVVA